MRRTTLLRAIGALALATSACRAAPAWRAVSPDHRTRVTVRADARRACVSVADREPRCHEAVDLRGMAFATRGGSIAYAAREGAAWTVVHDGVAGARWSAVGPPVLSADGGRLAYAASDGRWWQVVADGIAGAPFDSVVTRSLTFDAAGRRLAFAGWRGDSAHVVVNGAIGRGWRGATRLQFAGTGSRLAWIARVDGGDALVVEGVPGPSHAAIGEVAYSDARAAFAYAALDRDGWYVTDGAARRGPFAEVRWLTHRQAADGVSPVFVARSGRNETVVAGDSVIATHEHVTALAVPATGARWGHVANASVVYLDGREIAREAAAAELVLAADGGRHAYVAERGDTTLVVDERGRHRFDLVVDGTLQFLPDVAVWTCLAGDRSRRELFVVVDGRRTQRRLDWSELVRAAQRPDGATDRALRAWVAAEARLALAEGARR